MSKFKIGDRVITICDTQPGRALPRVDGLIQKLDPRAGMVVVYLVEWIDGVSTWEVEEDLDLFQEINAYNTTIQLPQASYPAGMTGRLGEDAWTKEAIDQYVATLAIKEGGLHLRDAIRKMVIMLNNCEWADSLSTDSDIADLDAAISNLIPQQSDFTRLTEIAETIDQYLTSNRQYGHKGRKRLTTQQVAEAAAVILNSNGVEKLCTEGLKLHIDDVRMIVNVVLRQT